MSVADGLPEPPAWHARAACRGLPSEWWFPSIDDDQGRPRSGAYDLARPVCEACPVRGECAEAGAHEQHGMWGGLSPRERRSARREAKAS